MLCGNPVVVIEAEFPGPGIFSIGVSMFGFESSFCAGRSRQRRSGYACLGEQSARSASFPFFAGFAELIVGKMVVRCGAHQSFRKFCTSAGSWMPGVGPTLGSKKARRPDRTPVRNSPTPSRTRRTSFSRVSRVPRARYARAPARIHGRSPGLRCPPGPARTIPERSRPWSD